MGKSSRGITESEYRRYTCTWSKRAYACIFRNVFIFVVYLFDNLRKKDTHYRYKLFRLTSYVVNCVRVAPPFFIVLLSAGVTAFEPSRNAN